MNPATDWAETIAADEPERFERYAQELRAMQQKRARASATGVADRALHAKAQCGALAEFTVLPDIPAHAKVALFATPKTYKAYVRFSNGAGARQPDKKPDVRALSVKLVGVPGKKVIQAIENAQTQDFLMVRTPVTPFRNADEFVGVLRAAESPALLLPRMIGQFGLVRSFQLLSTLFRGLAKPVFSVATMNYYSAVPIRFGPYAVHFAVAPRARLEPGAKPLRGPDSIGAEIADRLRKGPVEYDFQVQFYTDPVRTPLEDGSVEWLEKNAPFVTIARLTLPQQDVSSPRGRKVAEFIERLSFDPWHAQTELRPLGDLMRARNYAYRVSTSERGAAPEPDGSESF
jgi:hypothetical protein